MHKMIDPRFWGHPTPVNIILLILGGIIGLSIMAIVMSSALFILFTTLTWIGTWPWDLVNGR